LENNVNMFIWLPIIEGITTLKELDEHWTLCDLLDCHEALEIKNKAINKSANEHKGHSL